MHEVVYPNDVRMCQFEATFCLAPELVERGTIVNHQVGKKFERDIALQFFVACKPDYSHSASPEDLDQRVTAKGLLSAGELTRSRAHDIACAFVTHFDEVYITRVGRKLKARRACSYNAVQLRERLHETEVIEAWSKIVGEFIAAHSAPVALREGVLYVRVLQSALHYELEQISKMEILRKLKQRFGGKTIRDIRFRVG